jgi:hypothetical protein
VTYDPRGGPLDYTPCRYGRSRLLFRGPRRAADGSHVAVLGGTETYGKFIDTPYPDLLEQICGRPVLNLGCVNAGVDVFLGDPAVIELCQGAAATVIEITGAQNITNRFYAVHPRRNDRFLRASTMLKSMYRDLDFTEFNFTRHLLAGLAAASPQAFALVEAELKEAWVARMTALLGRIGGPAVLLWLSDHRPGAPGTDALMRGAPLLVDAAMLDALRPMAAAVVEVVADADELGEGFSQMHFSPLDAPAAAEMLGPVVHKRAAQRLAEALRGICPVPPPA